MSMIDITKKTHVFREARAEGEIRLLPRNIKLIQDGKVEKGDPFHTAEIAGVLAAKNTSSLIPLCHPLPLTNVQIEIRTIGESTIRVETTVKTRAQTGVEMEALTATAVTLLTIWDMMKQYEKDEEGQYPHTVIQNIRVSQKIKEAKI